MDAASTAEAHGRKRGQEAEDVYTSHWDAQVSWYSATTSKHSDPSFAVALADRPLSGHFHADEALAVSLLRRLPAYNPSSLLRTRDPALLASCHTVVDVGGEYDPSRNRYDHHQRTFDTTFLDRPTKLSSAGLVWLHFGKAIIATETQLAEDSAEVQILWHKLYQDFLEAIDAHDNGISVYDSAALAAAGIQKRFANGGGSISALVGDLNPDWNEPKPSDAQAAQTAEDARFLEASAYIGAAFHRKLSYYARSWLPARAIVQAAYADRKKHDARGRIMVFEQSVPWKDHLYTVEENHHHHHPPPPPTTENQEAAQDQAEDTEEKVLYVLYPESTSPESKWRIQAVPVTKDGFDSRKALPHSWRGLRDDKLDEVTAVQGGVFVHASGFIGGNRSWQGVKEMALKAVDF